MIQNDFYWLNNKKFIHHENQNLQMIENAKKKIKDLKITIQTSLNDLENIKIYLNKKNK